MVACDNDIEYMWSSVLHHTRADTNAYSI